jgi:SAM-dependent methyltransferase
MGHAPLYTEMAPWYDLIMQAGYYDYDAIAREVSDCLAAMGHWDPGHGFAAASVAEFGCGTGLILELLAGLGVGTLTGVDNTPAMLEIARKRLPGWVELIEQDVTSLDLGGRVYPVITCYGGPGYFVPAGDTYLLISHIPDRAGNAAWLAAAAAHLAPGGRLLLGVQRPHRSYAAPVGGGRTYHQQIIGRADVPGGFRKLYWLTEGETAGQPGEVLFTQAISYRVYGLGDALALAGLAGLRPLPPRPGGLFLEFGRA